MIKELHPLVDGLPVYSKLDRVTLINVSPLIMEKLN